jgi:2-amino-4-hydroxy-6-hydroxymethyldihydropteridine diphosphokinase
MAETRRIVFGLGSNLGDRSELLARAVACLRETPSLRVIAVAPAYETAPVGGPPQGDYLNSAVLVTSAASARDLLAIAGSVERALGRVRSVPNAPRTIDIDLLWIEGDQTDEPDLCVPHPRLPSRSFALRPLLDVAPDARDPKTGQAYTELQAAKEPLRRVSG